MKASFAFGHTKPCVSSKTGKGSRGSSDYVPPSLHSGVLCGHRCSTGPAVHEPGGQQWKQPGVFGCGFRHLRSCFHGISQYCLLLGDWGGQSVDPLNQHQHPHMHRRCCWGFTEQGLPGGNSSSCPACSGPMCSVAPGHWLPHCKCPVPREELAGPGAVACGTPSSFSLKQSILSFPGSLGNYRYFCFVSLF